MRLNHKLIEMASEESMMHSITLLIYEMVATRAREAKDAKKEFTAVELGVDYGHSTVAILSGIQRAGHGRLFSCDVVDVQGAIQQVKDGGLYHLWLLHLCDSLVFSENFKDNSVDTIFLDTNHEYAHTKRELSLWSEKLIPRGRILLHDTLTSFDGVGLAVSEFTRDHPSWKFYNIDVCCGLGVLTKPS